MKTNTFFLALFTASVAMSTALPRALADLPEGGLEDSNEETAIGLPVSRRPDAEPAARQMLTFKREHPDTAEETTDIGEIDTPAPTKNQQDYYRKVRAQRTIAIQNCMGNERTAAVEKLCLDLHGGKSIGDSLKGDVASERRFQAKRMQGAKSERFKQYYACLSAPNSENRFRAKTEDSNAAFKENMEQFETSHSNCLAEANGDCDQDCVQSEELFTDVAVKESKNLVSGENVCPKGKVEGPEGCVEEGSRQGSGRAPSSITEKYDSNGKLLCPGGTINRVGLTGKEKCVAR